MFKRVLIANRGEIAIRIARAAASLGVESVAVFTAADSQSLHTKLADKAREIGKSVADPLRAYLDIDAVIATAKESGADCVHPGYGFLSENATFAERCRAEGLR
ncbi:MAG TPA: biotin carboxylase N-terminal domain-containing protein, partial [Reyranella sp.]